MLDKLFRLWYENRQVTGETSTRKGGAPKGQIPINWDETLRQKDCNFIQSWKDPVLRLLIRA
jgi:hypothetical protein